MGEGVAVGGGVGEGQGGGGGPREERGGEAAGR